MLSTQIMELNEERAEAAAKLAAKDLEDANRERESVKGQHLRSVLMIGVSPKNTTANSSIKRRNLVLSALC